MSLPQFPKDIFSRTGALSAVRMLDAAIGVGVLAALTVSLPPSDVGYWFLVTGMILASQAVFEFRTSEAIFAFLPGMIAQSGFRESRAVIRTCLTAELFSGVLSVLGLYISFYLLSARYFDEPLSGACIAAALATCFFRAVNEPLDATVRAVQTGPCIFFTGVATVLIRGAAIVGSALFFRDFEYLVISLAFAGLINLCIVAISVVSAVYGSDVDSSEMKTPTRAELFRFLGFSSVIGLLNVVVLRVDELLLGLFVAPAVVAGYGIARRISGTSDIFFMPRNEALFSELSAAHTHAQREMIVYQERHRAMIMSACAVTCLVAIAPIVHFLLSDRYPGIGLTLALFAFTNLWFCRHWYRPLLATMGYQRFSAIFTLGSVLLFTVAALFLTPTLGITGLIVSHYVRIVAWLWLGGRAVSKHVVLSLTPIANLSTK